MLPFPHVFDFLAHKFSRLGRCRLAFLLVPPGSFQHFFFGHDQSSLCFAGSFSYLIAATVENQTEYRKLSKYAGPPIEAAQRDRSCLHQGGNAIKETHSIKWGEEG
jgi:hypothetical protein